MKFPKHMFKHFKKGLYGLLFFSLLFYTSLARAEKLKLSREVRNYILEIEKYWYVNPDSAIEYAREAFGKVNLKENSHDLAQLLFSTGSAFQFAGQPDSALKYYDLCISQCEALQLNKLKSRAIEQKGNVFRMTGNYEAAEECYLQALNFFESTRDYVNMHSVHINLGNIHIDRQRYQRALYHFLKAMDYDTLIREPSPRALNRMAIGVVYMALGDLFSGFDENKTRQYYEFSILYFRESYQIFHSDGHLMGICYSQYNLTEAFLALQQWEKADSVLNTISGCEKFSDRFLLISGILNRAKLLHSKGETDKALQTLKPLWDLKESERAEHFYDAMMYMANILRSEGYNDSARAVMTRVHQWYDQHRYHPRAYQTAAILAEWLTEDGMKESAMNFLHKANELIRVVVNEITNEIAEELTIKYQTEILRTKLDYSESLRKLQKHRYTIIIIILILLLIIAIGSLVLLNNVRKKNAALRQLAEQKAVSLETTNKLQTAELQKEKLQHQLVQQEVAFYSLKEIAMLTLIEKITKKLTPFVSRLKCKADQQVFSQILNEIRQESGVNNLTQYDNVIKQVHGDFFERILKINDTLSRRELYFCALLRMNLSSKDIARLLNIEVSTVDRTRFNIRKKLDLSPKQNLNAFLMSL